MPAKKNRVFGDFQLGLTSAKAKRLLEKYGPNTLPEKPPPSDIEVFTSQLKNPLVYILLGAATITALLGDISDTAIILLAVFINAVLGFWQERKATRELAALGRLVVPTSIVIRDGERKSIESSCLVPGDVVVLEEGMGIPADGRVVEAKHLFITEAILTGESQPVKKEKGNRVLMGTVVVTGRGRMVVAATGAETRMGRIALTLVPQGEETPLKKQLAGLSRRLAVLVGALAGFVFSLGFFSGKPASEIFITSVALAVSAIPEGLLISITAILAIGMRRILRRRGLVRRLLSVETLGGVTIICVDKTGTLTEGKLKVKDVFFDNLELGIKATALANNRHDPIDNALWEWVKKKSRDIRRIVKEYKRLDELPFSAKERLMATLNKGELVFVSGAPEILLERTGLLGKEKDTWRKRVDELAQKGLRVVGFAWRPAKKDEKQLEWSSVKDGLEWIGLVSFSDPLRAGVRDTLERARRAGIEVKIITGDYPETALAVMNELGMEIDHRHRAVMSGEELEGMSPEELVRRVSQIHLFARTSPEQKLAIVQALVAKGEVVAMMGDGVNDAPALKRADIGIVVGSATDVAKESADLVLLDSNFSTILGAIEEGRGIFENIRKIVAYLLSDAFSEITAVLGGLLLGLPLPVTASQILWINLVSDGFPNLALAVDPKRKGLMEEGPRPAGEQIINAQVKYIIILASLVSGILALFIFALFLKETGDLILARSMAFLILGVNSLFYIFSIRNLNEHIWKDNPLSNKWLVFAVGAGFLLQASVFYIPGAAGLFGVMPLGFLHWGIAIAAGFVGVLLIEAIKFFSVRRG